MSKSDVIFEAVDKISHVITSAISVVYHNIHMCNK